MTTDELIAELNNYAEYDEYPPFTTTARAIRDYLRSVVEDFAANGLKLKAAEEDNRRLAEECERLKVENAALRKEQDISKLSTSRICEAPARCPITGRKFFMQITAPDGGPPVPTYGGPYDSYTLPERDDEGFTVQRYDHDEGGWLIGEYERLDVRLYEENKVYDLEDERDTLKSSLASAEAERDRLRQRLAELEGRQVAAQ